MIIKYDEEKTKRIVPVIKIGNYMVPATVSKLFTKGSYNYNSFRSKTVGLTSLANASDDMFYMQPSKACFSVSVNKNATSISDYPFVPLNSGSKWPAEQIESIVSLHFTPNETYMPHHQYMWASHEHTLEHIKTISSSSSDGYATYIMDMQRADAENATHNISYTCDGVTTTYPYGFSYDISGTWYKKYCTYFDNDDEFYFGCSAFVLIEYLNYQQPSAVLNYPVKWSTTDSSGEQTSTNGYIMPYNRRSFFTAYDKNYLLVVCDPSIITSRNLYYDTGVQADDSYKKYIYCIGQPRLKLTFKTSLSFEYHVASWGLDIYPGEYVKYE